MLSMRFRWLLPCLRHCYATHAAYCCFITLRAYAAVTLLFMLMPCHATPIYLRRRYNAATLAHADFSLLLRRHYADDAAADMRHAACRFAAIDG